MSKTLQRIAAMSAFSVLLVSGCGGSVGEIGPADETPQADREAEKQGMMESAKKGGMSKTQMDKMMKYNQSQQKTQ